MAPTRKIVKKRIGRDGVEFVDCEQDDAPWIDIKESKYINFRQGRGVRYQRTIYKLRPNGDIRTFEDEPKITFANPDRPSQIIEYLKTKGLNHGIVKKSTLRAARGRHFQRTKITFYNGEENSTRQVREQRVENEETGDYLMVERIRRWTSKWGRGVSYRRKHVYPIHDEESIRDMEGPCKSDNEE
jgi:hypothetical protein